MGWAPTTQERIRSSWISSRRFQEERRLCCRCSGTRLWAKQGPFSHIAHAGHRDMVEPGSSSPSLVAS
eukprot:4908702-Prorocentrum_lima.AAC.1